jgi:SAM-dependent methyltransferase
MPRDDARSYWDARADEDALYFVDNREPYGAVDLERFWANGVSDLDTVLGFADANVTTADRVLDIGCGVGRLSRALASRAAHVTGIDVSPKMLERARELNADVANVEWIVGDGVSLGGVADASVDVVVSHVVFQHIPDPAITLGYVREIGRVLRPGGWAAFVVSNDAVVHRQRPALRDRVLAPAGRAPRGQSHPNWHGSHVELDALRAAVDDGGMELERIENAGTQWCVVRTRRL